MDLSDIKLDKKTKAKAEESWLYRLGEWLF